MAVDVTRKQHGEKCFVYLPDLYLWVSILQTKFPFRDEDRLDLGPKNVFTKLFD